ncbi:MAG: Calx-beta domain-containing protein, partial [Planctomycetaceae bacterium]
GEGVKVKLARRASLSEFQVDDSTISGNAGNGIDVELLEATSITDFIVVDSSVSSNMNGVSIERSGPAAIATLLERNNIHQNNADGLKVFITNRKTPVLRFDLFDNNFDDNTSDGIEFSTFADSISVVTAKRNTMDGNGGHGLSIQTNQDSGFGDPGDPLVGQPSETSAFENNTFNNNGLDGVHSVAIHNSRQLIRFDSPVDIDAAGNTQLLQNGDDGYSFEAFGTTVTTISIFGTDAMLNGDDAVAIATDNLAASTFVIGGLGANDVNNLGGIEPFEGNGGDGIDVSTRGGGVSSSGSILDLTVVGNRFQFNGADAVHMRHHDNSQVDAIFDNNSMRFSGDRGVDIQLTGFVGTRVNSGGMEVGGVSFVFTENTVSDNATEGMFFETNSGINQQFQARLSNTGAPSSNLLPPYDPRAIEFFGTHRAVELNQQRYDGDEFPWVNLFTDIVTRLTVTNNIIRDNGNAADSHGLFLNVGTNSYVAADVQSNIFGGNVLSDFHTDSFVSAGNPANAVNNSGAGTFDLVTLDDSAQLDLRFALNTGDHIAVDAIGALYTNNDPAKQNGANGNGTGPAFTREFSATNRRADIFRIDDAPGLNFPNNDFNQFGVQQDVRLGPAGFSQNGYIEVGFADPLFPSFGFPSDQTVFVTDLDVVEGNVGNTTAAFVVSLAKPATEIVTVTYAVTNNTATANVDFTPVSGTLTFNVGETTKTIDVPIIGDTLDEYDEMFHVSLLTSDNATIIDGLAIGTILDDDAAPLISVSDATSVMEGNTGTVNAVFTISLSKTSTKVITTNYAAAFGTSVEGEDYQATSGTLTFNPGETVKVVSVPVIGDLKDEIDESFALYVLDMVNVDIADALGEVIILDDDGPPTITITDDVVPPAPSQANVQAVVTVNLSDASGKTVTVDFTTDNGSATSGSDYTAQLGTLTFNPGEVSKTITINVVGNTLNEFDENFFVHLSNASNAVVIDNEGRIDVQGDSLTVDGTAALDQFDFAVNGQVTVTVNGTATNYGLARYRRYLLNGLAGNDTIQIHGTSADESVRIDPGHLVWNGVNLLVDATSFTTVDVFGGGGTDTANLYDTVGDDLFTSVVSKGTLTGSGLTHQVHQFANINVYAYAGGNDLAELFDTPGVDRFIGRDTRSNMTGVGYNHSVTRFERVNAYAWQGGYDLAYLHGSAGDDRFVGRPGRSTLRGLSYFNMATSFEGVYAFAKPGGNDTALLIDSTADDVYFGSTNTGTLSGGGYLNQAIDFKLVEVQASTGNDKAEVIDVNTVDTVFGSGNLFELTRSVQKDRLTGFDQIKARSKPGHTPTANVLAVDYVFIEEGTWA